MHTKIHPLPVLSGRYDLRALETAEFEGARVAKIGVVRIGAGTWSPAEGLRSSARHEIAFIVEGQVRVETKDDTRIANAHDVIVSSPAELHATTALSDTTIFYVLIDPAGV
jgi:quercetin dioxygenase-like cupin family protein